MGKVTILAMQLESSLAKLRRAKILSLSESFEAGYVAEPNTGCWLWLRSLNNMGYGKICGFGNERSELAHRYSYELHRGPIPDGMVLDHKCRTPACVNPDHLEAVTQGENTRRGRLAHVAQTGKCARGHAVEMRHGRRYCRECNTLWHRNRRNRCRTGEA